MAHGEVAQNVAKPDLAMGDRRSTRRYRIEAVVSYKVFSRNKLVGVGSGSTLNISSGGVLFKSANAVPPRRRIELAVAWPFRLDNVTALELWATGTTLPPRGGCTAVKITRYDFRVGTPGKGIRNRETGITLG
jgi:hypothetical protein